MSDSSEEKTLPPTKQKLKKARQKGQVVTAPEAIASAVSVLTLLYLFARRRAIWDDMVALFEITPNPDLPFMAQLADAAQISLRLGMTLVLPVIIAVVVISTLIGMAITGGPLLAFSNLVPKFEKLNPAKAFKNMFGKSAWLKFMMHVIRLIAIMSVPGLILWYSVGALLPTPPCGLACASRGVEQMITPMLIAAVSIMILVALFDYLVQRANFMRDQKMSLSEVKREYKEQEGDPQLRSQMRSDQQAMVDRPTGLAQASVVLTDGRRRAIGVRYAPPETPAPLIVVRARGAEAVAKMIRAAKVPVHDDAALVEMIGAIPVGHWISEDEHINAIAPYLM